MRVDIAEIKENPMGNTCKTHERGDKIMLSPRKPEANIIGTHKCTHAENIKVDLKDI
jgi:hypothetical protein